jgi:hypothetical protein
MTAQKQGRGLDVSQSSNQTLASMTHSPDHFVMRTHPNYRGTILGLVIIIVVCGFIVFTHFIIAR